MKQQDALQTKTAIDSTAVRSSGALAYPNFLEEVVQKYCLENVSTLSASAKIVIAVESVSSTGHSPLAILLARELSRKHQILSKPIAAGAFRDQVSPAVGRADRSEQGGAETASDIDWQALAAVIASFRAGRLCEIPIRDTVNLTPGVLTTYFGQIQALVIGGLTAAEVEQGMSSGLFSLKTSEPAINSGELFNQAELKAICNNSMLGDTLLLETKKHRVGISLAEEIIARIETGKDKFVVAIAGASGTGKSEILFEVVAALESKGIKAKGTSIDNFYKIDPTARKKWRVSNGIDTVVGLGEIDWKNLSEVVSSFRESSTVKFSLVDLSTDMVDQQAFSFAGIQVFLVDGLFAANMPDADLVVFVDIPFEKTQKAQALRGKEVVDDVRQQILRAELKTVLSLKSKAHLLITEEYEVIEADTAQKTAANN